MLSDNSSTKFKATPRDSWHSLVSLCDEKGDIDRARRPWEFLPAGHKIGTPEPLFKELKDEEVEFFREKFAGSQADRIVKAEAEAKKIAEQLRKNKSLRWQWKEATANKICN